MKPTRSFLEELSAKLTYNMLQKDFSFQVMLQLEQ